MRNRISLITGLVGVLVISACIGGVTEPNMNEAQGSDLNEEMRCIVPLDTLDELIITSQEEYNYLLGYASDSPGCKGALSLWLIFLSTRSWRSMLQVQGVQ